MEGVYLSVQCIDVAVVHYDIIRGPQAGGPIRLGCQDRCDLLARNSIPPGYTPVLNFGRDVDHQDPVQRVVLSAFHQQGNNNDAIGSIALFCQGECPIADAWVQDVFQLSAPSRVGEYDAPQFGAIEVAVRVQDFVPEPGPNLCQPRLAARHQFTSDCVGVDYRDAKGGEVARNLCLAAADTAGQTDAHSARHLSRPYPTSGDSCWISVRPTAG